MKNILVLSLLPVIALGLAAGKLIDDKMKDLLKQLQLNDDYAKTMIFSDCSGPSFYFPNPKDLKKTAMGDRVAIVETVAKYVKEYTSSKEFINRYNDYRETKKPSPPEKPMTVDEMKRQQKDGLKEGIANLKAIKPQMPADQQASIDESIKSLEGQLKEIDNPDNPMFSPEFDMMMQDSYKMQMDEYNQRVVKWEEEYPVNNPNKMIKNWISEFLSRSKDVDFGAKTALDEKGRTLFVKQEYERKDNLWKVCFRTGKEATEAGRKFAQSWLNELN